MHFAYDTLTTLAPRLDTPRFEAAWNRYWAPGVTRRLVPLGLATLLVVGAPTPARAQWVVHDIFAQLQRASHYLDQITKWTWDKNNEYTKGLREVLLAARAYHESRDLITRIGNINATWSVADALPTIQTSFANGTQETLTMRPVYTPDQAPPLHAPQVQVQPLNFNNLDFDVDRNVIQGPSPYAQATPTELHQQAVDAGYLAWQTAQQIQGVPTFVGTSDLKDSMRIQLGSYYTNRQNLLQEEALTALQAYGENSPQYRYVINQEADLQQDIANGTQYQIADAISAKLQAINSDAQRRIDDDAANSLAMMETAQRGQATQDNIKKIALNYDSNPNNPGLGTQFFGSLLSGLASLSGTLNAMSTTYGQNPNSKYATPPETLGDALKRSALLDWSGANQSQALQVQTRQNNSHAQTAMLVDARRESDLLAAEQQREADQEAADKAFLLAMQVRHITNTLNAGAVVLAMPTGTTPVLTADEAKSLGVGVTPDQAGSALASDVATLSSNAATTLKTGVSSGVQTAGLSVSWGFLQPVATALDAAVHAAGYRSFNLTKAFTPQT